MAEETKSPIEAPKPPAVNPLSSATSAHAATLKLKPVIRKPVIGGAKPTFGKPSKPALAPAGLKPAAPSPIAKPVDPASTSSTPVEQLKKITQKLKGVTQQIPQQAILHKTGIIAEQSLTDAQKLASKSRTTRISLSDAIGAAPVQNEAAPMKTIRIKRPVDLNSAPTEVEKPALKPASVESSAESNVSVTQRKTLKIARPGGVARPSPTGSKMALKKSAPANEGGSVPEVADIPDIPAAPAAPISTVAVSKGDYDVPTWIMAPSIIIQVVACVAMAVLGVLLYFDLNANWF